MHCIGTSIHTNAYVRKRFPLANFAWHFTSACRRLLNELVAVVDAGLDALFIVDLESGDRVMVSR